MSTNLPGYNPDALVWLEAHITMWTASAATIGLTSAVVTSIQSDITDARNSFTSVQALRADAKVGTSDFRTKADTMRENASNAISTSKAFAENSDTPSTVYTAAGITPTAPSTPTPAPDQPGNVSAMLKNDGSIMVTWDGKGPTGTVSQIYRKLPLETTFSVIGRTGSRLKEFSDTTVPSAIASVTYQVRAQHAEKFSLFSSQVTVQFGGTDGEVAMAA